MQKYQIQVFCPICRKSKNIDMDEKIINQSKNLTTVSVPSALVCEHTFQAFVDKNFIVRGYQKVDYEVDFSNEIDFELKELTSEQLFVIINSFNKFQFACLINAIFSNKKIIILYDNDSFTVKNLILLLDIIIHDTFIYSIKSFERKEFNFNDYDNYLIISGEDVFMGKKKVKSKSVSNMEIENKHAEYLYSLPVNVKKVAHLRNEINVIKGDLDALHKSIIDGKIRKNSKGIYDYDSIRDFFLLKSVSKSYIDKMCDLLFIQHKIKVMSHVELKLINNQLI